MIGRLNTGLWGATVKTSKSLHLSALACLAIAFAVALTASAQTVTQFDFNGKTGYEPYSTITQGTDGNFYGTTGFGGQGNGNIFRMTPSGAITNIHNFCQEAKCADGWGGASPLTLGPDGNLYGVTYADTLYRLTDNGGFETLFTFCGGVCYAPNGLTLGSDGYFYGTSNGGGISTNGNGGNGTIFKLNSSGDFTLLYSFCSLSNCTDGAYPLTPPLQGRDGNFYGTAYDGGTNGTGVVYKLTPSGQYSVLYNFGPWDNDSFADGTYPAGLVQDADGNFVGATQNGGVHHNGVVFKITTAGKYSVLYSFGTSSAYVGWSSAALTLASDGNFYGVLGGGPSGSWDPNVPGGLYKVTPDGAFTSLFRFCQFEGCEFNPLAPMIQATDGNLYGTAAFGGIPADYLTPDQGFGGTYQLATGLGPVVKTVPAVAAAGQSVLILGNHLTGTSSVTFNGVEAKFTVESDTYIKATVPAGATTGVVSVVTPTGTLNSNLQFVVTK